MNSFENILKELGIDTADSVDKINTGKDAFASPVVNYDEYLTAIKNKDDIDASIPHPYGHGILKVYHGTDFKSLKLKDLDSSKSRLHRQFFGPGIYFTNNIDTAASYGSNIIETTIDIDKLINGYTYDTDNIEYYRGLGYVGAIFKMRRNDLGCVIWNMDDVR